MSQKVPKRLPVHLLDALREHTMYALRVTTDLDLSSVTTGPNVRTCEPSKNICYWIWTFLGLSVALRHFLHVVSTYIAIFADSTRSYELWNDAKWQPPCWKVSKQFHDRTRKCWKKIYGGQAIGKADAVCCIKALFRSPWSAGAIPRCINPA